jgi:hypothetical protein
MALPYVALSSGMKWRRKRRRVIQLFDDLFHSDIYLNKSVLMFYLW